MRLWTLLRAKLPAELKNGGNEGPVKRAIQELTKTECPQCKQWFEDEELDEQLLRGHMPEIPLVKNQESQPSGFSEAQEARIRSIAREEKGGLKTLLILTDLVILFIFYIPWKFGLL